ncbi:MAG: sugar transferase [Candidatus Limnocylindrales bacterium]
MIRRHATAFRAILVVADALLAVVVLLAVSAVRFGPDVGVTIDPNLSHAPLFLMLYAAGWVAALASQCLYRARARWTLWGLVSDVIRSVLIFAVAALAVLFVAKLGDVSRVLLLLLFPSLAVAALIPRLALRGLLVFLRTHGGNTRYMLIAGTDHEAQAFADLVEGHHELGITVIGHLRAASGEMPVGLGRPVLGEIEDIEAILHSHIVDEVAICLPFSDWERITQLTRLCEDEGRIARIPMQFLDQMLVGGRFEDLEGLPIYSVVTGPDRSLGLIAKRLLDLIGSALLLLVLAPLMAAIAILIRRDSPGPALFQQDRVGLHGRPFRVVKFRTMSRDAEGRLPGLMTQNRIQGHAFKMDHDPRITRVGRRLRRMSLDELPQLWNVLRGDMSLVGPRPPLPSEVAGYDIWHRRRLSMKPGMTGLWQVRARREPDFDRWVETDLEYIDHWSFWLDLRIIVRTVPAVLSGQGR